MHCKLREGFPLDKWAEKVTRPTSQSYLSQTIKQDFCRALSKFLMIIKTLQLKQATVGHVIFSVSDKYSQAEL